MDNKAQLSLELIIIIAAIIAIAMIMFKTLSANVSSASEKLTESTDEVLSEIDKLIK